MLGGGTYPITIAEMSNYAREADTYFEFEEHEGLKTFLALPPESGDIIAGTGGVRMLRWPHNAGAKSRPARVIYYFRDLNMPLYMLALYKRGEHIPLSGEWKEEIKACVDELVAQHSERWANILGKQPRSGKEPA
jgi:hypothetical protein